jgi:transcriptional regulator GlxA family with amidase domain
MWSVMTRVWRVRRLAAMTKNVYFLPMRRIVVIAFEGAQTLDVTGPAEVFAAANRHCGHDAYAVTLASRGGGPIRTSSGIVMRTRDLLRLRPRSIDTVVVSGGEDGAVAAAVRDAACVRWIRRASAVVRRTSSVCSGAFLLAAAGLLDGKRATTHWSVCDGLAAFRPEVTVDRNAIFVREGPVWTSAGVTTGIDMALAMVDEDLGRAAADGVAGRLVLYVRRPGFQSQFSDALVAQTTGSDPLGGAIAWARGHLGNVDIDRVARHAGVSSRTLHRRCLEQLGTTPAKLLDKLRVEHARTLLSSTSMSAKSLAHACGFGNPVRMKRAFQRELGMGPREYAMLHPLAQGKAAVVKHGA